MQEEWHWGAILKILELVVMKILKKTGQLKVGGKVNKRKDSLMIEQWRLSMKLIIKLIQKRE